MENQQTLCGLIVLSLVLTQEKVRKRKSRLTEKMAGNSPSEETNKLGAFGAVGQYSFLKPKEGIS